MFKNSRKDYKPPLWPLTPSEDVNSLPSLDADRDTEQAAEQPQVSLCGHHRQSRHRVYKQAITGSYTQDFSALKIFGPQNCFHGYGRKGIKHHKGKII